jgi:hypothetical protein
MAGLRTGPMLCLLTSTAGELVGTSLGCLDHHTCWHLVDLGEINMPNGAWSLGEWPLPMVRVACAKCGRARQYHTHRLIQEHGADMVMPELRHVLAQCPRRRTFSDPCMIVCTDRVER